MENQQRPAIPAMFNQLEIAYARLADHFQAQPLERERLTTVLADLRWYAERLGEERWEKAPGAKRWSFAENVWHITEQAVQEAEQLEANSIVYFIDHGKEHVGQAAEIIAIFEY
jgi:hypothetical protein